MISSQLPGVRCLACAANGEEVWVILGRACRYCLACAFFLICRHFAARLREQFQAGLIPKTFQEVIGTS
jgi:hypothetical protein